MVRLMVILVIALFCFSNLPAQNLDSCGLDNAPALNVHEALFLNSHYMNGAEGFNFSDKKIAYVTAPGGSSIITKSEYFKSIRNSVKDTINGSYLIVFSKEEKALSGGYDGVITYWVKVILKGQKWLIKKLKAGA